MIDSLERGYKEKTNPDFLILEINSSRYAYNMSLSEVNFYVVQALLNLYPIKEANGNVLTAFNQIFAKLHGVLKNYIRGSEAMGDCLKAIEVMGFPYVQKKERKMLYSFQFPDHDTGKLSSKRNVKIKNYANHSFFVQKRNHHRRKHFIVAR